MVVKVLQIGHPKLREVAKSTTDFSSTAVQEIKQNLVDTLRTEKTGVAISAVQIGSELNLFVIETKPIPNRPEIEVVGPLFFFNPEIVHTSSESVGMFEACLSIMAAQLYGEVTRPKAIKLRYQTETGETVEADYDGFLARVIQHEVDHLHGKLFTDIADPQTLSTVDEYRKRLSRQKAAK